MRRMTIVTVFVVTVLALVKTQYTATTTALGTLAASMQPGSWATLVTNNIDATLGPTLQTGSSFNILAEGPKLVWDKNSQQLFFFGSDHRDLSKFVSYDATTNNWQVLPRAAWMPTTSSYNYGMLHGEDHSAIDSANGNYYHREFGLYVRKVHRYNVATQTWTDLPLFGSSSDYIESTVGVEYFPDIRSLFIINGGGGVPKHNNIYLFSEDTQQWTTINLGQSGPPESQRTFARYNPVHHVMVFNTAGYGDRRLFKMDAQKRVTQLRDAPIGLGIMCPCDMPSTLFLADPVSGDYIVISKDTKEMWRYDVVTDTWTKLSVQIPASVFTRSYDTAVPNPIFSVAAATLEDLGVQMFVSCDHVVTNGVHGTTCRVNLFKYAAGAAPPAFDFSLSNGGNQTAVQGQSKVVAVNSTLTSGTAAPVSFSASGLPAGATASFSAASCTPSCSSNLTIATSASTPTGTSTITVTGVGGSLSRTTTLTLTVNTAASFDFSLANAGAASVTQGLSTTSTVSASLVSGTTQSVSFTASGLPAGATASFNPASCSAPCSSIMTVNAAASTVVGTYPLVVTGTAGALTRTTSFNLSVAAPSSNPTVYDFAALCARAGVLKCVGFDATADITGTYGDNKGSFSGDAAPQIDPSVKSSGGASLKFTIPANSAANSSGSYFTNFSTDLQTQFGENSEFFVQWRQRFSPEFLNTVYAGGGGWKQAIIGTGDKPGCTASTSANGLCYASCTALETVTQNTFTRGFPQMYNSCLGSTSHGPYDPFTEKYGSTDFKMQNGRPAPYCLYSQSSTGYFPPNGNCFGYFANEWMTFQVHIKTGPKVNDEFTNSYVKLWVAREGQPGELVLNWGPYNLTAGPVGTDQKYGKVWLLPYNTGKNSTVTYPTAYTWYDDLIISTQPIPIGGSSGGTGDTTAPTVSMTAPGAGATVSGTATVSANASDNVGVSGVQFLLDGANFGAEDTTSPYSVSWNTTTVSNGTHTLAAVARDAAGNRTTSAAVTVTVSNVVADTTPPVISAVGSSGVTTTGATISWTTNEASDTQVDYGLTTSYGSQTALNTAAVTSHTQGLSGLTAGTTYNYRVKSKDAAGNLSTSGNFTFTTSTVGGRTIDIYPGTDVFGPAAQSLVAGDTLIVHQGTYNETSRMSVQVRGTVSAPITIKGASGEAKPLITRPVGAALQNTINIEGSATYLTLRGLEISGNGAGGDGVYMNGALSYITLEDLDIHDIDVGINMRASMSFITVRRNHIFNTGINSGTGEGMYVGCNNGTCAVHDAIIEQNWVHDSLPGTTQGDGIEVKVASYGNIVRDNVVYNRAYPGIFVYGTGTNPVNIVEGNVVWNSLEGIYAVADAIVRNNIVFNSGTGLSLYSHAQVSQMKNVTAVNNTLYNNDDGVYMRWGASALNMVLANNAVYSPGKQALNLSGSAGTFVGNYVEGAADRSLNGTAFINGGTSANAFADAANRNFWPKAGSILLNIAISGYAPANDFNQMSRTAPFDIGAYETNGAATNPGWAITTGFKTIRNTGSVPTGLEDCWWNCELITAVSDLTGSGATISWNTVQASDSQIEYGTSLSYGSQTAVDPALVLEHSQALSGLAAGTTYNYRVKSRDAAGNLAVSDNFTFTTPLVDVSVPDTTPPVVSDVNVSNVTARSATINWKTSESADSKVDYAVSGRAKQQTFGDNAMVTAHSQTISGLLPGLTYSFTVTSRDAAGNAVTSARFVFTTAPLSGSK